MIATLSRRCIAHAAPSRPGRPAQWAGGFTLVELLTAIGIIAVLSALLFPVLARARAGAQATACLTNLRQIGLAIRAYQQDWDDRYPWAVDPIDKSLPGIWAAYPDFMGQIPAMPLLHALLLPYARHRELFRCPLDSGYEVADWVGRTLDARPTSFARLGTSYSYRTDITRLQIPDGAFRAPARVAVLFDACGRWHGSWDVGEWRYNVLHGDGHAKSLSRGQMDLELALPP